MVLSAPSEAFLNIPSSILSSVGRWSLDSVAVSLHSPKNEHVGVDQNYGHLFGPLDYKEYTIIQTPKGPIILINPHVGVDP